MGLIALSISANCRMPSLPASCGTGVGHRLCLVRPFIFPSDSESFGNVTLEAMASGLACVCADATGSSSLVVPGETGFLVPADDAGGFARQLTVLAQDEVLRRRMGEAARLRAQGFSWEETLARMLGYYRALLAGTPDLKTSS
jgi:glycosyltransferase involved in cell wall biosynthesis